MTDTGPGMRAARRVYVYALTAIALVFVAIGAVNLLEVAFNTLFEAVSDRTWMLGGADWERERLSFAIPFLVIGIPIWFLHWRLAERSLRGDEAAAEREAIVRGVFLLVVLAITLQMTIGNLIGFISGALRDRFGQALDRFERDALVSNLAWVVVGAAILLFHLRVVVRDARAAPMRGRGPLLPQLYLHAATGAGFLLTMFGAARLMEVGFDAMTGDNPVGRWWASALASALALLVTGATVWTLHGLIIRHLLAGAAWWGRSRSEARLRHGAWTISIVAAALFVVLGISQAIETVIEPGQGVKEVIAPIGFALPFVAGWLFYRQRLIAEPPDRAGPVPPVVRQRLSDYGLALLGIAWGATGLVLLLSRGLGRLASDGAPPWRDSLAWPVGMTVAGFALWGWRWENTSRRLASDPDAEQASTVRRTYLLAVLGAAVVGLLVGLATTAYQLLQRLLGVDDPGSLSRDLAWPLALTIVALVGGAIHGRSLQRDLAVRPLTGSEPVAGVTRLTLILTGPPAGDIRVVAEALGDQLPEGYRLDIARRVERIDPDAETNGPDGPSLTGPSLFQPGQG